MGRVINRVGAGATAWNPLLPLGTLVQEYWQRGDLGVTQGTPPDVTGQNDQSGNAIHLTATQAPDRMPHLTSPNAAINNQDSIEHGTWAAQDHYLHGSASFSFPSDDYLIGMVVDPVTPLSGDQTIFRFVCGGGDLTFYFEESSGFYSYEYTGIMITSTASPIAGPQYIVLDMVAPNACAIRRNGVQVDSGLNFAQAVHAGSAYNVGLWSVGVWQYHGDLAELLVYSGSRAAGDIANMEAYFASFYGIP